MAGNLIIPRVEVYWGETNLTSYNGSIKSFPQGEPVVYKVECRLPNESQNPDGTLMWAPTAAALEVYKDLTDNHINEQIVTTFGYLGKKTISFVWIWGGQRIVYGNSQEMQVNLLSELSGLINADTRSTANNADYSMTMLDAISKTEKFFQVDKFKLVKYSEKAAQDLKTTKIQNQYGRDQTFVGEINKLVRENGNYVFSTNILPAGGTSGSEPTSKLVIFTPFTYEGDKDSVLDGATISPNTSPDPTKRYGYLLGPSVFNSMERSFRWQPPQQIMAPTAAKASLAVTNKGKKEKVVQPNPADKNHQSVAGSKGGARGPSRASSHPGVSIQQDKVGPRKQILQQLEATSTLTFHTFLVPAFVGIKPYDIVYVPSLAAKSENDIEDWIVTTVDYNQTDGGIEISVTATRPYGTGSSLMNKTSGNKFLEKAKKLKTLEDWEAYAWQFTATPEASPDMLSNGVIDHTMAENFRKGGDSFG